MRNAQAKFVLAVMFSCLAKVSCAAGLTSFAGIGLGNTTAEISGTNGQAASSGAGYRIVAGNQVSSLFSVEAEYVDLGQFATATSNIAAKGLGIAGVLTMPVTGMFSIYGKAGYARIETIVSPLSAATTAQSDAVAGMALGYGIQIDVAPNASIRLAWDRYKSSVLAGSFTDRIDMNSSGLLILRF